MNVNAIDSPLKNKALTSKLNGWMRQMGKRGTWPRDKRALSPIFATVLLSSIIILFGSTAYYYASNITTTTTNDYVSSLTNSQQSIAERISFENVIYTQTFPATLKIYVLNSGSANNLKINAVFIYDSSHNIVGAYSGNPISALNPIDESIPSPTPITGNALNVGKEAYFTVTLAGPSLISGSIYTLHLITQSGSYFTHEFTP